MVCSHLGGLLQVDHDLAERVTGLDCSQCLWRFVEGVGLKHLGIDFARGDQVGDSGCWTVSQVPVVEGSERCGRSIGSSAGTGRVDAMVTRVPPRSPGSVFS